MYFHDKFLGFGTLFVFCNSLEVKQKFYMVLLFNYIMETEQEIKLESFRKLKLASLLNIITIILGIVFGILAFYVFISIAMNAVSNNISPGSTGSYIFKRIISDHYYIILISSIYAFFAITGVYSIYLYSRSILLLSSFNKNLNGPAKFSKYLYLVIIVAYLSEILYVYFLFFSVPNIPVFILYISLLIIEFFLIIYLYIGIYRIGVIYNSSSIRLGSIFYFIPFLDLAAPFLLYSGSKKLIFETEEMDNNVLKS